jgi:hypothetical protein
VFDANARSCLAFTEETAHRTRASSTCSATTQPDPLRRIWIYSCEADVACERRELGRSETPAMRGLMYPSRPRVRMSPLTHCFEIHCWAAVAGLPRGSTAVVIVEDRAEIEPAPAQYHDICAVCLPKPIDPSCRVFELFGHFDCDEGRTD